jgi:ABC-type sugar transport system ATPase subunit
LSGGNQQRLVLGRWLATTPRVLLLDEPTRGVDVGAKSQIHEQIRQLADAGLATLVISSELPELLSLCDRILAIRDGAIQGEVRARDATPEQVLELILPDREAVAKS